jgi:Na+-transporting methylmalonyl-CoA/oxaloacetate decarboxylase gamma subunit
MMKLLKYLVMGIAALIAIGIGFAVLGLAVGLATLAIKIGVVVLIGYGVVRLFGGMKKHDSPKISDADRKWLES